MSWRRWAGLGLLLSTLSAATAQTLSWTEPESASRIDRWQQAGTQFHPPPLRWDNVDGSPRWVDGLRPQFQRHAGLHTVALQPGEAILVRLPAGSWLRLHDPLRPLCPAEYEVAIGNGGGGYAVQAPLASDLPYNLLYRDAYGEERVALITRLGRCGDAGARRLALFVSRDESAGELTPYRDELTLPLAPLRIHSGRDGDYHQAYRLAPGRPVPFDIEGPRRIAVQTRLIFGDDGEHAASAVARQATPIDTYSLRWTRAEPSLGPLRCQAAEAPGLFSFTAMLNLASCQSRRHVWRHLEFDTTPEYRAPLEVAGCLTPTGRLETRYLDIPAGRHRFHLHASSRMLLRLRAVPREDYLLPALNRPWPDAGRLQQALTAPGTPADQPPLLRLDEALRIDRDNSLQEGSLRAAARLLATPRLSPYAEALQGEARRLWQRSTSYRGVLPEQDGSARRAAYAWFLQYRLPAYFDHGESVSVAPEHRGATLGGLDAAYFSPLSMPLKGQACATATATAEAALQYLLPERHEESRLRVLLDLPANLTATTVWAQLDQQPPVRLIVSRRHGGTLQQALPQPADGALALARDAAAGPEAVGFWGGLAASHAPASVLRPFAVELPLPVGARRLRLWAQAAPSCGLRAAVQYRSSLPYKLSDSDYLMALEPLAENLRLPLFASLLAPTGSDGRPLQGWRALAGRYASRAESAEQARRLRAAGHSISELLQVDASGAEHWELLGPPQPDEAAARTMARQFAAIVGGKATASVLPQDASDGVAAWESALRDRNSELPRLGQHWLPLLRYLQDRAGRYAAAVAPPPVEYAAEMPQAQAAAEAARRHLADEDWVLALERWAPLLRAGPAGLRAEALRGQTQALRQLGEAGLAEQVLRGTVLYDRLPSVRDLAEELLLEEYRKSGDDAAVEGLLAARLLREPARRPAVGRQLVRHFAAQGESAFALDLGLLLPRCYRPLDAMLQAALELRREQSFALLVEESPEAEERALWRGLQAARLGQSARARAHWQAAGVRGRQWLGALDSGEVLSRQLAETDPRRRDAAVARWAQWTAAHPGPQRWMFAPERVVEHAGLRNVEVLSRALYLQAFVATADQPLRLKLQGPGRLRLELRPLIQGTEPADGWIQLRHNGRLRPLPYTHNRDVAGLALQDQERSAVGRAEEAVLELGPGAHEVVVSAAAHRLLVRPYEWRPALPLPSAAPLTPETLAAVMGEGLVSPLRNAGLERLDAGVHHFPSRLLGQGSCALQPLDLIDGLPAALPISPTVPTACSLDPEPAEAAALRPLQPPLLPATPAQLLAAAPPEEGAAQLSRLVALLWWQDQKPAAALNVAAEALAQATPQLPSADLMARLRRYSEWEPVEAVDASAGTYTQSGEGWAPESPYLRARRALLPLSLGEQLVLYGEEAAVMHFVNSESTPLQLKLSLHELPYASAAPMRLELYLNGRRQERLLLDTVSRQLQRRLVLPPGEHLVELRSAEVYANQFVAVQLLDEGGHQPIRPAIERRYHVATRAEPLRLKAAEPSWLRIEEWQGAQTHIRYQRLDAGESLSLQPGPGEAQALFRLHRRALRTKDRGPVVATPVRSAPIRLQAPAAPPEPGGQCTRDCRDPLVQLRDLFPLGGQEDGTWGLTLRALQRRAQGEDQRGGFSAERYYEMSADYRYYDARRQTYLRAEPLLRVHEQGRPTLGLRSWADWEPRHSPWSVQGFGSFYTQPLRPKDGQGWASALTLRLEAQLHTRHGTRTDNTFNAGLFGRWLSLRRVGAGVEFDQDVFTRYKLQHRAGCLLSDRLSYRPWLDTEWFLRGELGCNEDFDPTAPDYLDGALGWRQWLGTAGFDLSYRHRHFRRDDDRAAALDRRSLELSAEWDTWTLARNRWWMGVDLGYDLDQASTTGSLMFGYNRNNGRAYLDFRPSDVAFKSLRQRNWIADWPNNLLNEDARY